MSTYAIGDIQGCYDELRRLLDHLNFDPASDTLLFAGDLVNRGPKSLEVLRFVKSLGNAANSVLGNHDLHLLAVSQNNHSHASGKSLDAIFEAQDKTELLDWLRHRPLLIHDEQLECTVIHAGLPPQWTLNDARLHAKELEATLQGESFSNFCAQMYGNKPKKWNQELEGIDRLRFITNCFTRLRYCTKKGKLGLKDKGPPGTQKAKFHPWFDIENRKTRHDKIFFGHWSTLGLLNRNNAWALDTGCLWGGQLTAIRLEDLHIFQVTCEAAQTPRRSYALS